MLVLAQEVDWERAIDSRARQLDGLHRFISLQDVADVLHAHTYYSNKVRKAVLYLGDHRVTVTAFNPFVIVDQNAIQMPVDTRYLDGDILVPVKFFLPVLKSLLKDPSNTFVLSNGVDQFEPAFNISGVEAEEKANGTLIRISTAKKFESEHLSTRYSRKWLYLDILGGKIDEKSLNTDIASGMIKQFVPVQLEQMAQLSFEMKQDVAEKRINLISHPNEIWISIPTKVTAESSILEKLKTDQQKWLIDRIVIDPGHGGRDPGAIGARGVYEKDVVLNIAKKLKELISKNLGIDVLMTREDDEYLSLKERTQLANKHQAKLFISIHANWNRNQSVNGATTYFLGLAKSEESLEIAQRENAVIKYDDDAQATARLTDENVILAAMAQNSYNKESQDFAAMIQQSLNKTTGIRNRGIKQAGFYVLVGASMPNVLVETAFISNKEEEKLLKSTSFQNKVARAIYESVKQFKEQHEWTTTLN